MTTNKNEHGILKRFLFFLKFLEIRLRFVAILAITALLVGYWDTVQNYYERWQRERAAAHAGPGGSAQPATPAAESEDEYYCPMHPFVVRDHKGNCPICGMELAKRKKGAAATLPAGTLARVQVSPERIMQAGVQVEPVGYRLLAREVRSYGTIEPAEQKMAKIVARFPGRVDKLMVNTVGMSVKKDQALASIYSPKFLAAAQEYIQAIASQRRLEKLAGAGADEKRRSAELTDYARQRLILAGFTERQIADISSGGGPGADVTLYSPLAGTVLERNVLQGESVEEGTVLCTIADLSTLWVQASISESELAVVKDGMPAEVTTLAYPGKIFYGTVDFIYPTVNNENRAGKVRIVIAQPEGKLKPGMVATVVLRSPLGELQVVGSGVPFSGGSAAKAGAAKPTSTALKLPTQTQADAERFLKTVKPGGEYYVCSMHPEVVSDKPGDCPLCGMHLSKTAKKAIKLPTIAPQEADAFLASTPAGGEYYQCPMHPEVVSDKQEDCPICGMHLEKKTKSDSLNTMTAAHSPEITSETAVPQSDASATERWAEGWACTMHPTQLDDKPGICAICACGMQKQHLRVERVLSVPETAVIDTGARKVVYVESQPGVYDSRAVTLGPRAGAFYPVQAGLKAGDRIVARGSFLVDAEARLN